MDIEKQEIIFRNWPVVIERKAFRRSITISLRPESAIRVRVNIKTPLSEIEGFLLQKEKWIEKHMNRFAEEAEKFPPKKLLQSETFPFLGETLHLKFIESDKKKVYFSKQNSHLLMHVPASLWNDITEEDLQKYTPQLIEFYKKEAAALLEQRLSIWSEKMRLFPKLMKIRSQKNLWGSCSSEGHIHMNWRLIGAPITVMDYVLIHELAHLKYLNHSDRFWNLVESHCPHYRVSEKWLKDHHSLLSFKF